MKRTYDSTLRDDAILGALLLAVTMLLVWAGQAWLDMPMVYQSNSTGECVKVVTKQGDGSCDNLPSRYDLIITE